MILSHRLISKDRTVAPSTVDHEQFDGFIRFLSDEWTGARPHSYQVPTKGRSSTWSKSLDPVGNWSTRGLKNAFEKYNWNGKTFSENKAQLDNLALELQSAITASDNPKVNDTALAIMSWGGVNNKHRQRRTKKWLSDNNRCLSEKIKKAVSLLHIETEPLLPFDGTELIMNSAVTKIISLADPNNKLIIYDGRACPTRAPRPNEQRSNRSRPCFKAFRSPGRLRCFVTVGRCIEGPAHPRVKPD